SFRSPDCRRGARSPLRVLRRRADRGNCKRCCIRRRRTSGHRVRLCHRTPYRTACANGCLTRRPPRTTRGPVASSYRPRGNDSSPLHLPTSSCTTFYFAAHAFSPRKVRRAFLEESFGLDQALALSHCPSTRASISLL